MCVAGAGTRQVYSYETLIWYADSPQSKLPPADHESYPPELARKVNEDGPPPLRAPHAYREPARAPHHPRCPRACLPPHGPNYLAKLLCQNFY